jgi:hypothetical protein
MQSMLLVEWWSLIELSQQALERLRSYLHRVSPKVSVECSCPDKTKPSLSVSIPSWFHMSAFGFAKVVGRLAELPGNLRLLLSLALAGPIP